MVDTRICGVLEASRRSGGLQCALAFVILCQTMTVASITHRYFQMQANPLWGPTRLGDSRTVKSRTACANHCMTAFENCTSFLFNSTTGLCTPSALTNETQPLPTSEEGDLFQSFHCNTSTSFSAAIYGDTVVCVALFGPANYAEAGADCQDKGAFLASVKTSEKYSFLSQVAGNHNLWVGCDDLLQEGTFVWREDGQEVTLIERTNVFDPSDPATDDDLEDCISFQPSHSGLRDDDCSLSQSYFCEMPYG